VRQSGRLTKSYAENVGANSRAKKASSVGDLARHERSRANRELGERTLHRATDANFRPPPDPQGLPRNSRPGNRTPEGIHPNRKPLEVEFAQMVARVRNELLPTGAVGLRARALMLPI
jgi:hypothetical protein